MTFKTIVLTHLLLLWVGSVSKASDAAERSARDSDVLDIPMDALTATDALAQHMFRLYERYIVQLNGLKDENTVRSFKAKPENVEQRVLYRLNLTSLQGSEVILTSTFHFLFDKRPRQRSWFCQRFKNPSCRNKNYNHLPPFHLLFRSPSSGSAAGSFLGNITVVPHRRGAWLTKDVSVIVKEARDKNHLLITVELDYGDKYQRYQDQLSPSILPYLLVYANDLAISEPNSVAMSLQRYDPFLTDHQPTQSPHASPDLRVKRDLDIDFPDPIENNELPEVEHNSFKQHDMWESAYFALKPKAFKKERRRKGQEHSDGFSKSQVLKFDEKTMKKARRRQWKEPQGCSRRYMKVDFSDIGWNEWVLSPKSFDAFYCAGTCEFPIPKVVRPSNHAAIQSIVKAVGIIPGIPEPCCVPEKMKSLAVLFLDESKNIVLKIYPNMSVETCACR
ncbi:growth/differentiation factor 10 [Triplophysa dalaica]|uniref:growth/differentiation factor 10 n=1 Tax=Triplophysa dalaica TaxID=1582913 RepID=UPI0024DFD597|nr:growth/differentiation factor 10 [Triplophysa dalaica]WUV41728.1 BMP3b-1 [Triplophysa dalaica]